MKILFSSYTFSPDVGGIESVSTILAQQFAKAGHEIEVITETPGDFEDRITRGPSLRKLLGLLSWCDLFFQNNISLRSLIPALFLGKRSIVVHQTWLRSHAGKIGWNNRIKRALLSRVTNVAISEAIRGDICRAAAPVALAGGALALQSSIRVIYNPYDHQTFRLLSNIPRDKTLVFAGRLVSDKGVDLLLQAMKILQNDGLEPDLSIIGSGPEEGNLRQLTQALNLDRQVTFAGKQVGSELAELLNRHRILIVPSRWAEPFGIVALEGIACGCVVVGSAEGGLKEAIGPCGLIFPNGDEHALAARLKELLLDPAKIGFLRENAQSHLAKFRRDAIASAYLGLIEQR